MIKANFKLFLAFMLIGTLNIDSYAVDDSGFKFYIKSLTSNTSTQKDVTSNSATVGDLKTLYYEFMDANDADDVVLYYKGTKLDDDKTLADYNIQENETLVYWNGVDKLAIDETTFPDGIFGLYVTTNFDTDQDGYLSASEILAVTEIDCSNREITWLNGIEYFIMLEELTCIENSISVLDLTQNTQVKELFISNNKINVLKCNNDLEYLDCSSNRLSELDLSNNTKLKTLMCYENDLKSLDLSNNTALEYLDCSNNELTSLDLSNNNNLNYFECLDNYYNVGKVEKTGFVMPNVIFENVDESTLWDCTIEKDEITGGTRFIPERYGIESMSFSYIVNGNDNYSLFCNLLVSVIDPIVVAIDEEHFPDENFRNFVLENFDQNESKNLEASEIEHITEVYCHKSDISSLTGIEYFTNLEYLYCNNNQLTSLDLSNNTALEYLDCSGNDLTELDLSYNTALDFLECSYNHFTTFDLSQNTNLYNFNCLDNTYDIGEIEKTGFVMPNVIFENVDESTLWDCTIEKDEETGGTRFIPNGYGIESMSFSYIVNGNDNYSLFCNLLVSVIDPIVVAIDEEHFPDENFRNFVLENFDQNESKNLEASEIEHITEVYCHKSDISSLTGIEYFTNLEYLYCNNNQLTSLDLSNNTALEYLDCSDNNLAELDLSNNTNLSSLNCSKNLLTELDLSVNINLENVVCRNNQLTAIDLSNKSYLWNFDGNENTFELSEISAEGMFVLPKNVDYSKVELLSEGVDIVEGPRGVALFTITDNSLSYFSYMYDVNNENVSDKLIVTIVLPIDESKNIAIDEINFPDENFRQYVKFFDENKNGKLSPLEISMCTQIDCSNTDVTSLKGIEFFTSLQQLYCSGIQLTELDLSNNTYLVKLNCSENQLTSLDLSKNTNLHELYCHNNQIDFGEVSVKGIELPNVLQENITSITGGTILNNTDKTIIVPNSADETEISYYYNLGNTKFDTAQFKILFEIPKYRVTVMSSDEKFGKVSDNNGVYANGETLEISCQANEGYHFVKWSSGSTKINDTILVVSDTALVATFEAHSFGEWDTTLVATCTTSGMRSHICSCGAFEVDTIDVLPHTIVIDTLVPSTCTHWGLKEGSHCSVCKTVLVKQDTIEALGHKVVTDTAVAATCTHWGLKEGSHCSVCKTIFVKQDTIEALGHSFTLYVYNDDATTEADGTKTAACDHEGCDETDTQVAVGTKLEPTLSEKTEGDKISIYTFGRSIVVENADADINVYDVTGRLVARKEGVHFVSERIEVPNIGVYVVKCGDVVRRVSVIQ